MGTNYYWHDKPCGHCGRADLIHVGKSGATWRGYPHRLFNAENPDWGYDPASPFGFPVVSLDDWRTVFAERPGELWDEYGRRVEQDPVTWLSECRPPSRERRDEIAEWGRPGDDTWYDPGGFYFVAREFS